MNIEEAKANIGKEVVYFGNDPDLMDHCINTSFVKIVEIHRGNKFALVETEKGKKYFQLKFIELKHSTYKVGDQVVLDESTKPYYNSFNGIDNIISFELREEQHSITSIYSNGCVVIKNSIGGEVAINPRHLKLAPQEEVELFEFNFTEEDFKQFNMPCTPKKLEPEYQPRLKDVTNLLQSLDVAFSVEENGFAFTVNFSDTSFQVMKNDYEALRYAEALLIAEKLDKTTEFDVLMADKIKAIVLLQSHGFNAKLNMRGIEVV